MVLAAGVFLAGCDLTTNPGNKGNSSPGNNGSSGTNNSGELDGTWKYGSYEIIINGDNYVMKANGTNYGKGTITYSVANSTFTFRSTHEWTGSGWSPDKETTNGKLTYAGGDTLIISNIANLDYKALEGTWTRQSGSAGNTDQKTITITGFPGSSYSSKVAMVMLSPSLTSLVNEEMTAVGGVPVTGTRLTFPLYRDVNLTTGWNGTGSYIIALAVTSTGSDIEKMWFYSNGSPINPDSPDVPKYNITETTSTIPFDKFDDVTDMMQSD
jgi:hypothetical protein